jgi:hypothetical protein
MSISTQSIEYGSRRRLHAHHLTEALTALLLGGLVVLAFVVPAGPVKHFGRGARWDATRSLTVAPSPGAASSTQIVRLHYHGFGR